MKVICSLKIFIIIDLFKSIEEKPKFQGIAFKDKVTKKNKKIPKNNNFQVKNVINFFKEQKEIKKSEKIIQFYSKIMEYLKIKILI